MRLEKWHSKEIFKAYEDRAMDNANTVMDEVKVAAKQKLAASVIAIPPIVRQGRNTHAFVSFTPKTGKNKGQLVEFSTDKRWTGRRSIASTPQDQLYNSIRRVNVPNGSNVRVYCGNSLAYWASMVEKTGFTDRGGKFHQPLHFLQAPFHAMKQSFTSKIAKG